MDSGAALIRNFHGDDLIANLRRVIKRNQVGSLALGTAIGLIAGFAFRRPDQKANVFTDPLGSTNEIRAMGRGQKRNAMRRGGKRVCHSQAIG